MRTRTPPTGIGGHHPWLALPVLRTVRCTMAEAARVVIADDDQPREREILAAGPDSGPLHAGDA